MLTWIAMLQISLAKIANPEMFDAVLKVMIRSLIQINILERFLSPMSWAKAEDGSWRMTIEVGESPATQAWCSMPQMRTVKWTHQAPCSGCLAPFEIEIFQCMDSQESLWELWSMDQTTVNTAVWKEVLRRHHQGKEIREKGSKRAVKGLKECESSDSD